jgi:hypothetical protein
MADDSPMNTRRPPAVRGPSLQTDLPSFIIPPGTQVVLKAAKRVPGTEHSKPSGSVAEVITSPSSNRASYVVRFADGVQLRAKFSELVIRRREVAEELRTPSDLFTTPGRDLRPYVIYRVAVEANIRPLSRLFDLRFVDDLIAQKRAGELADTHELRLDASQELERSRAKQLQHAARTQQCELVYYVRGQNRYDVFDAQVKVAAVRHFSIVRVVSAPFAAGQHN